MSDTPMKEYVKCCFCGWECDPHSQACGPCMRLTSTMDPKDIVYYQEDDFDVNMEDTPSVEVIEEDVMDVIEDEPNE